MPHATVKRGARAGPRALVSVLSEILNRKHTDLAWRSYLSTPFPEGMVWKIP